MKLAYMHPVRPVPTDTSNRLHCHYPWVIHLISLCLICSNARTDVLVWTNPQGGAFNDKNDWAQANGGSQNHVPGGGDVACIGGGQPDICGAGGAASVSGTIFVSGGTVDTLNLRFATFSLAGTFSASNGELANATVSGAGDATLSLGNLTLFQTTINGPMLQVNGEGIFSELTLNQGTVSSHSATLGNTASTLDGVGSSWNSGPLSDTSSSGLTVQNGAQLTSANVDVTQSSLFSVTGPGSTWSMGELNVGSARFILNDGGHVNSDEAIFGVGSTASADITIDGSAASWGFGGELHLGYDAKSSVRLHVINGAVVPLSHNTTVGEGGAAAVIVQGGGQMNISGGLSGRLDVGSLSGSEGGFSVDGNGSLLAIDVASFIGNAGSGSLTASGGGTAQITEVCALGGVPGANGSISASGVGSSVRLRQTVAVGDAGAGTLSVSHGAAIQSFGAETRFAVGNKPTGSGAISISDPGSQLTLEGLTFIGVFGTGTVGVTFGGTWQSSLVALGSAPGSSGDVQLFGANSYWTNADNVLVGGTPTAQPGGVGTVGVNNNAVAEVGRGLYISASGAVSVGPAGYMLVGSGPLGPAGAVQVSQSGVLGGKGIVHGGVIVASGGTLQPGFHDISRGTFSVDGDVQQNNGGTLKIEVDGLNPGTQHDVLVVSGKTALAGNLVINFANVFAPKPGDAIGFLRHGINAITGQFSNIQITGVSTNFQYKLQDQSGILYLVALNSPAPTSPPVLSINPSASEIQIAWPAAATGYTLQSSSDIASGSWQDEAASSSTVVIQPTAKVRFFRLKKP